MSGEGVISAGVDWFWYDSGVEVIGLVLSVVRLDLCLATERARISESQ